MKIFIVILIVISFFSCSNSQSDEMIINEIFQDLTVVMYFHNDILTSLFPPPPIPPNDYENDSLRRIDSITHQEAIEYYKEQLEKQKRKSNYIVLAIGDSLISYSEQDLKYLKKELPSEKYFEALNAIEREDYVAKKIDLNAITETGNYELRYLSTFYPLKDIWETERDYRFSGFLLFSRIYYDNTKQYGILYCSYLCGHLCGHGDFVFIKQIDGKWIIEKTVNVWVS